MRGMVDKKAGRRARRRVERIKQKESGEKKMAGNKKVKK
jgi:hypothetical protein